MAIVYVAENTIRMNGYTGFTWSCSACGKHHRYDDERECRDVGLAHQLSHDSPAVPPTGTEKGERA